MIRQDLHLASRLSTELNCISTATIAKKHKFSNSRAIRPQEVEAMAPIFTASAPTGSTNDKQNRPESRPQNVKQESTPNSSKADNDPSSWNVVVSKRQHVSSSSVPTPAGGNRSKQQSQKPNSNKQRLPKQQTLPQQQRKANNHNNNTKTHTKNINNRKPQQKNSSIESSKKKAKPKPKAMTVGDMLPFSKKKKFNKDGDKKFSQQHQPKAKQEFSNQHPYRDSYQRQPSQRQQQTYSNLHTESVQDFPALGSGNFPTLSQPSVPAVPKQGWGTVPKPPPSAPFHSEIKKSDSSTRAHSNNNRQTDPSFPKPTPSSSSPPSKLAKPDARVLPLVATAQQHPTRVLKRGEAMRGKIVASVASIKKKKEKATNTYHKTKPIQQEVISSASSFFQPRPRDSHSVSQLPGGRQFDGEEHQLLRLVQERNVYQKRGRQRVAPRKKKFSALKKKVLQERLDQWRALHPEDVPNKAENGLHESNPLSAITNGSSQGLFLTRYLCLYNYTEPDELEDDDEYEEILENLTSMATKIGPIDEAFLPRSSVLEKNRNHSSDKVYDTADENNHGCGNDCPYRHPVFVVFQKKSDASAALACWNNLLIGGRELEVFGLDVREETSEAPSPWSERALAAELKRRNETGKSSLSRESKAMEILLQMVLTDEDYEDEDCMSESLDDLKKITQQFGKVEAIRAAGQNGDVLVTYGNVSLEDSQAIAQELCRVVVGGQPLYASVCEPPTNRSERQTGSPTSIPSTILLENVLTEDDLQDSDCLQESLNDIKELCLRYGDVLDIVAKGSAVKVTYEDNRENAKIAETAACELSGIVLGGNTVKASVVTTVYGDENSFDHSIDLYNIITEDDMEDKDCMEESLSDVEQLASTYGKVMSICLCKAEGVSSNDPAKAYVRIQFAGDSTSVVAKAFEGLNGMVIGGQIISASLSGLTSPQASETTNPGDKRKPTETPQSTITSKASDNKKKARTDDKEPLYSGDKLISERFAEMKRVPKIPNKAGPRPYASSVTTDERIKPLLKEMLGELMRLQKRAIEDKNAKARRRMVMGLREVARGIRAHKGMCIGMP